jgi:acyl-CoA thioester hydrolase
MDAYGHVNHANTVTLLEEARTELLFVEATRQGADELARGMVVAKLSVDYHTQLVADGKSVRIAMSVRDLRAASFTLDYAVHSGRNESDAVVTTAQTLLVPYDFEAQRLRRLTDQERDFLAGYRAATNSA